MTIFLPLRTFLCVAAFCLSCGPLFNCIYVWGLAQRGWEAGEQVLISYGPRSNDHLLQRYGFVEPNNPNDVYRITGLVNKVRVSAPSLDPFVTGRYGVAFPNVCFRPAWPLIYLLPCISVVALSYVRILCFRSSCFHFYLHA